MSTKILILHSITILASLQSENNQSNPNLLQRNTNRSQSQKDELPSVIFVKNQIGTYTEFYPAIFNASFPQNIMYFPLISSCLNTSHVTIKINGTERPLDALYPIIKSLNPLKIDYLPVFFENLSMPSYYIYSSEKSSQNTLSANPYKIQIQKIFLSKNFELQPIQDNQVTQFEKVFFCVNLSTNQPQIIDIHSQENHFAKTINLSDHILFSSNPATIAIQPLNYNQLRSKHKDLSNEQLQQSITSSSRIGFPAQFNDMSTVVNPAENTLQENVVSSTSM
ncbi:hypothetical protein EDEG_02802 [Edhazardia aedis USNM 41457]|uniref:Uncharacterized protein n=1 Tax=Edhazardia aedis (strain USNM 41457) TaxID=1003232 RepID=J9D4R8_EDHAE|nr:hypothetical protein EDEG_02802 [Edhazardia aedis USNM 41457]|eukprot:EJW02806.1 hypothetical protein EDEG_02802 [Edhazardia aedis USNM 41457]